MYDAIKERDIKLAAIFVTLTVFVTRFNISAGVLMNGFLLLLSTCLLCFSTKRIFPLTTEIKIYLKAFLVFFLSIIPSILFSGRIFDSFCFFFFMLCQYGGFILIILLIRKRKYLVWMLTAFFIFSGFDCLLSLFQLIAGQAWDNRGYGFGGKLLTLADIMCMLLPMALVILMDSRFEMKLRKSAAFASIGVIVGLLCNKSRGAWLTELIVVPIAVFRYLKQNRKYLIAFALVILGMVGYMATNPQYVQRIRSITNTTTDYSNADRIWTWKSAQRMIMDHPVTGVGFGLFHEKYEKHYKYEQETQNLPHTHNNFIQVAVECGIIGTIGFLYFVCVCLYTSLRNYRKCINPYDLLIFTIFLAHICLFGQIDYTIWVSPGMQPTFLFLLAILLRLKETDTIICKV